MNHKKALVAEIGTTLGAGSLTAIRDPAFEARQRCSNPAPMAEQDRINALKLSQRDVRS